MLDADMASGRCSLKSRCRDLLALEDGLLIPQASKVSLHLTGHVGRVSVGINLLLTVPLTASYTAAKSAVAGLTRQIALDYAADKIHCNALSPGL